MKPTKPFGDVEHLIMDTPVPKIDVKDRVLEKLRERKNQREAVRVKKKIGLIVAACLVFGVTSAYAAMKVYELKNEKGEVVVQINQTAKDPVTSQHKTYGQMLKEVRESVKPGTAVAVYIVPDNPQKIVAFFQKPITSTDRRVIQAEAGNMFAFPADLTGGYTFKEGFVQHMIIHDYKKEDFYKQAEETKKDVIVKELKVEPTIEQLGATYANHKGEVRIRIENFEKVKYVSTEAGPDDTVEKVKVGKREALYHLRKIKGADGKTESMEQSIEYFKDEAKLLYHVWTSSPEITKQDLLAIVEKLEESQPFD